MSDNQLAQLTKAVQAMGKRFDGIDKRFDSIDKKFDGRFEDMESRFDGQFTKLYKHMNKEFSKIHKRLDQTATKGKLNTYANAVDAFAKQTETYHQEMDVLSHKVDRHEKWHEQTAKAVGLNLSA